MSHFLPLKEVLAALALVAIFFGIPALMAIALWGWPW